MDSTARSTARGPAAACWTLGLRIAICVAAVGCSSSTGPGDAVGRAPAHPSAEQVLDWMTNAYRSAASYADSGELRLRFVTGDEQKVDERVDFSVSYVGPNKLRAHCYQAIVVSDGAKLRATIGELPGQVLSVDAPAQIGLISLLNIDPTLNQSLSDQIAGTPPQLGLLFGDSYLETLRQGAKDTRLLPSERCDDRQCQRVLIERPEGEIVFWIDEETHALLRVDYPASGLAMHLEQQVGRKVSNIELWADLRGARFNGSIEDVAFQFELPGDAKIVSTFDTRSLMPPPPEPSKLLGSTIGEFRFLRPDGTPVTRESLAGKVVVIDFWATWCDPCVVSLPNLDAVYQKYKDDDRVAFLAVSIDQPDVDDREVAAKAEAIKISVPLARDKTQAAFKAFGIEGIPNLFILGPDGKVEDNDIGLNHKLAEELPARIEKLLAGESLQAEARERYESRKAEYEQALREPLADEGQSSTTK